jgi:hypothetical protein
MERSKILANKTEKALKFASRAARARAKILKGQSLVFAHTKGAGSWQTHAFMFMLRC